MRQARWPEAWPCGWRPWRLADLPLIQPMRRFYLAYDSESSKRPSFIELLALLSSSTSIAICCSCRVSLDEAVATCLTSAFKTIALIEGSDEREMARDIAWSLEPPQAGALAKNSALLMTDALLDSLSQDITSYFGGQTFLINYDLPRDLSVDDRRISLFFGADRKEGVVIIDMFSSLEIAQFKAIESHYGEIPPLPMALEDILG